MPATYRTGEPNEPGVAAEASAPSLQRVSWSPPQPVRTSPNGTIAIRRDRQGVIHITNVPVEEPPPAGPLIPALAVQKQARPPAAVLPVVRPVSCPELGPEVANYLEAKLRDASQALTGQTVRRYRDPGGVWRIDNEPAPDVQLSEAPLAASAGKIMVAASAHGPPVPPTFPAMAWGPGLVRPPTASPDQRSGRPARPARGFACFHPRLRSIYGGSEQSRQFFGESFPGPASLHHRGGPVVSTADSLDPGYHPAGIQLRPSGRVSQRSHGVDATHAGHGGFLGVRDAFDFRENILAGCRHFRYLLDYFQGNVPLALAGYNAGQHRVISAGCQVPAIKETQEFVTQVMGLYYLLEKHAAGL